MSFLLRIEGFGSIQYYDVLPTTTVLEVKQLFCDFIKQSVISVAPFVNHRLLFESHTLAEAHVTQETPIKMYDLETAKLILNTVHSESSIMKIEKKSSVVSSVQPMGRLRPWSDEETKPKKGGLGLF
jgi:hypothetical protein